MSQIQLQGITKYYSGKKDKRRAAAVKGIDLEIEPGEFVFVTGSGGAGKSTLLRLICGDLTPTYGTVYLNRLNVSRLSRWHHQRLRRYFGYVPQISQLERKKTIGESLVEAAIPRLMGPPVVERVQSTLKLVGLSGAETKYPVQLSQADCRWAELACAIINNPPVLVIDELTDNLDGDSIWDMMHLLDEINRLGSTVIMATHAKRFVNILRKRVITMVDGRIWGDVPQGRFGDIS